MKRIALIAAAVIALAACSEKVPMEIVDQNQIISRENSLLNARGYVRAVGTFGDVTVTGDSDSTISKECRFGDGWASVKVVQNGNVVAKLKCQTTGSGKGTNGCLSDAEFKTKEYATQDGKCDSSITSLPKLNK